MGASQTLKPVTQVNFDDFKSLEFAILLSNTTTLMDIKDSSLVKIVEFLPEGLVLRVPKGSCSVGHILTLLLIPGKAKMKVKKMPNERTDPRIITMTAKIQEMTLEEPDHAIVTVEFYQRLSGQWKKFIDSLSDRQKQIIKVMKAVKK